MTLTEFLLARIAEDETRAMPAWRNGELAPDRITREVEAKRRIVRAHNVHCDGSCSDGNPANGYPIHQAHYWSMTVLAAVYDDHPDYRDEWRA